MLVKFFLANILRTNCGQILLYLSRQTQQNQANNQVKLEKIINGLTERQQDVYQVIEEHPLDFITPTELSKKVEFAEKEKTNLDLFRRTLDQLVKKRLVQKEKGSGDKNSIENRYRKIH